MHSSIVPNTPPPPAPEPAFTFPGIFRNKRTGSLWIASSPTYALRLVSPPFPERGGPGHVGMEIGDCGTTQFGPRDVTIRPELYEQVCESLTITFHLP